MTRMHIGIGTAVLIVLGLVSLGVVARTSEPDSGGQSHAVSMSESAQALQHAGSVMQAHGLVMLDEGRRTDDASLIVDGQHWFADGQDLINRGNWLLMAPTAPGSLVANPVDLKANGSWAELNRSARQMVHDPRHAGAVDIDALQWDGEAMRAEGHLMADHGRVMADAVEQMIARHGMQGQEALDLRSSVDTLRDVGGRLERTGQGMLDYAEQLRTSLGE